MSIISKSVFGDLLIINIIIYLLFYYVLGLDSDTFYQLCLNDLRGDDFRIYQFLTYQFLHVNFSHIFFNLLFLFLLIDPVEKYLSNSRFLILYLFSGVFGGIFHYFLSEEVLPLAGSSASIFGVLMFYALLNKDNYTDLILFSIKSKYFFGSFFLLEILFCFSVDSNVSHLAHIGGSIFGLIFFYIERYRRRIGFTNPFRNLF